MNPAHSHGAARAGAYPPRRGGFLRGSRLDKRGCRQHCEKLQRI